MQLELRHLRVICLIAEVGTLSKAAATLGVPQPSVTAQLKRIENALGGQLFVRGRTGVVPTELGEAAIARSRTIVRHVDELLNDAYSRAGEVRSLRIGGTPGMVFSFVSGKLRDLSARHSVVVRTEHHSPLLLDLLARGELDGAMFIEYPGVPPRLPPGCRRAAIATGPAFVIMPSTHRLANETHVSLSDLGDDEWVLPPASGDGFRGYLRQVFAEAGIGMRVSYEIADAASAMNAIIFDKALGVGQAIRPNQLGLVLKPLVGNPVRYTHVLVWPEHGSLARHADALVASARAYYASTALESPTFRTWLQLNDVPEDRVNDPWECVT